jgi:hypothetical protein
MVDDGSNGPGPRSGLGVVDRCDPLRPDLSLALV